jgi:hypothetical protein
VTIYGKKRFLEKYFRATTRRVISPGIIAMIQSFGKRINFHPHLHFLVIEGGQIKKVYKIDPLIYPKCGG